MPKATPRADDPAAQEARRRRRINPPPRILVVAHEDGWVEVYCESYCNVRFVNRLSAGVLHDFCPDEESAEIETLLDEHIAAQLPKSWRGVYWPANLVGSGQCERRTAEQTLIAAVELSIVRELAGPFRELLAAPKTKPEPVERKEGVA